MEQRYLHVDMNAFYASVEQAKNPRLKNKPVIVCGDPEGRGVVSAASYEARRYGVHSAMPATSAKRLCPDGIFVEVHMSEYTAISRKIMRILEEYTPVVDPVSIDEAFLDVLGCEHLGTPMKIAKAIKQRIFRDFDLTCSIGVSYNRLFSKMASDMQKPDGLVLIHRADVETKIWPLPVKRLIGVGEKTALRFNNLGIMTIGQLARAPIELLEEKFGSTGRSFVLMARGEQDMGWGGQARQKSIGRETTFSSDVDSRDVLRGELLAICEEVASRIRKERYQAKGIFIKYRYPDFSTYTRAKTLDRFVDTASPLFEACWELLLENVPEGKPLRLLGATAFGLVEPEEFRQGALPLEPERQPAVKTVDALRSKYGPKVLRRASALKNDSTKGQRP